MPALTVSVVTCDGSGKVGSVDLGQDAPKADLPQDDADQSLEKLLDSAERIDDALKEKTKPRSRRVFGENPFLPAEPLDSWTLRRIPQMSPAGF